MMPFLSCSSCFASPSLCVRDLVKFFSPLLIVCPAAAVVLYLHLLCACNHAGCIFRYAMPRGSSNRCRGSCSLTIRLLTFGHDPASCIVSGFGDVTSYLAMVAERFGRGQEAVQRCPGTHEADSSDFVFAAMIAAMF